MHQEPLQIHYVFVAVSIRYCNVSIQIYLCGCASVIVLKKNYTKLVKSITILAFALQCPLKLYHLLRFQ